MSPRPTPSNHAIEPRRAAALARAVADWFATSARDLPWRTTTTTTTTRDPYRSLVSELMLQQTQVARVLEKFQPFLERFPTLASLANAPEQQVLAAWSGLGYYRRAKLLHAAAKAIARDHAGVVPDALDDLLALPGIGRYTAGAIASIVFNQPAPIVDGNIARVLLRVEARPERPGHPPTDRWLWRAAADLAHAADHPARTNEGLMELGATLCTPANPRCDQCPLRNRCHARREGTQSTIPLPKPAADRQTIRCLTLAVLSPTGRFLVEQRPPDGLWAGLWQCPTLEHPTPAESARPAGVKPAARNQPAARNHPNQRTNHAPSPAAARARLTALGLDLSPARALIAFEHQTSHRRVIFDARLARARNSPPLPPTHRWLDPTEPGSLAISNAQHRIIRAAMARILPA